jgi:hypothetical protein
MSLVYPGMYGNCIGVHSHQLSFTYSL